MDTHVKVLGILNIVFGVVGLCVAILLTVIFGGVAGLAGANGDPEATFVLGIVGFAAVSIMVVTSLPSIIIGYGLYQRLPWSRVAGIIISILSLISIPFGTALGIYGLWVLFSKDGERVFAEPAGASGA
jgi:hypothetical protein